LVDGIEERKEEAKKDAIGEKRMFLLTDCTVMDFFVTTFKDK